MIFVQVDKIHSINIHIPVHVWYPLNFPIMVTAQVNIFAILNLFIFVCNSNTDLHFTICVLRTTFEVEINLMIQKNSYR
jgi:hypothetical protein